MTNWSSPPQLLLEVAALAFLGGGIVATIVMRRRWPLLLPLPAVLTSLAWYGWEFSGEAAFYSVLLAAFGYAGIGLGVVVRHAARRRSFKF
jgi:hypothetical protein